MGIFLKMEIFLHGPFRGMATIFSNKISCLESDRNTQSLSRWRTLVQPWPSASGALTTRPTTFSYRGSCPQSGRSFGSRSGPPGIGDSDSGWRKLYIYPDFLYPDFDILECRIRIAFFYYHNRKTKTITNNISKDGSVDQRLSWSPLRPVGVSCPASRSWPRTSWAWPGSSENSLSVPPR